MGSQSEEQEDQYGWQANMGIEKIFRKQTIIQEADTPAWWPEEEAEGLYIDASDLFI